MQQNTTGPGHSSRVQFPEQLTGAEIPRPPSTRPLPRVGSHNRDPSVPWSASHPNEGYERTRNSSIGSSYRPEGIGLGRPSRSPAHVPSPLNPSIRRSSGQHIHRKKDSFETVDTSKYDFDHAFGQSEAGDDVHTVAPDHSEGIAKLAQLQRKRRKAAEGQRGVRQEEASISRMELYPDSLNLSRGDTSRSKRATSRPEPSLQASSATLAELNSRPFNPTPTSTVRSNTPSSQEHSQESVRGNDSEELWTNVFQKGNKGKGRAPLTEEQYNDLERATDARISKLRAQTSPAGMERARTAADQLQRRYDLFFPSVAPGETPFNLMKVMRWRREKFAESLKTSSSGRPSREAEIEKRSLSWRPHLTDLHDPKCPRYRSRIYVPWHLTACLMEESLQPSKPALSPSSLSNNSPNRAVPATGSDTELRPPSERMIGGDISGENDSNQSGGELLSRGLGSLRRFRKSIPGPSSKSVDLSPRASPHQSRTSISSLHLFGPGGAISPSNSRAHINKLLNTFSPPKTVGEHSDDGHLSGSANEKEGYVSSGRKIRISGGEQDRLGLPLSEEERSHRSSDDGKAGSPIKRLRPRHFFTREETVIPTNTRQRAESTPIPHPVSEHNYSKELDLMTPKPDPTKRFRLSPAHKHVEIQEEKEEEIDELNLTYDQRERECHELDELIAEMNQEQYQLLQLGREYLKEVAELKRRYHLDGFKFLAENDFRVLTEPTSRSQVRHEELSSQPGFMDSRIVGEIEARRLRQEILDGLFAPPLTSDVYFDSEEQLDSEFRKLADVGRDLDYVAQVAVDHTARSKHVEVALKSLKTALGAAFAHSSQVYREIIAIETLVAASRPVPTWKRVSDSVKPMLSWGVTILTWVLKFLGEVGRVVGFFLPAFLKNRFRWEMLSGRWNVFIYCLHFFSLLCLRWILGLYWSFEVGWVIFVWAAVLGYVLHPFYLACAWYNRELRYYVLNDWWESSRSPSLTEFMRRHWYAIMLLLWPLAASCGLTYWLLRPYL